MKKIFWILTLMLALIGCTEPYGLQTRNFESALVIEATITNEMKQHAISISRTFRFEENGPAFETGATVYVQDDLGNTIDFIEQDGKYVSETAFAPDPERNYVLHVMTSDGKSYSSTPERQTATTAIESLVPINTPVGGVGGVKICVNTSDPTGSSKYYRYEYEEAGRFQTPFYYDEEIKIGPDDNDEDNFEEILVVPRTEEAHTCYRTGKTKGIIIASTADFAEDRLVDFPIRTIPDTAYILNDRYGIKVRQYVQTLAAHNFYKTMRDISSSGSILSQVQPGFFYGNIRNDENPEEKVIGIFEVSSVSEKTLFFNYNQVFPNHLPLPWPYECSERILNPENWSYPRPLGDAHIIIDLTQAGTMDLYSYTPIGWFILKSDHCVDCTATGVNTPPDFWEN